MPNEPEFLIIPAAGLGTRMKSVRSDLPKELLPVGGKPAIQYAVEEGIAAGIKNIVIIISRQKEIIRRYFEDTNLCSQIFPNAITQLEKILKAARFTFLYQKEPLGESDAISYAKDIAANTPVAIIHPDDIYLPSPGALTILKDVYREYQKDVISLLEVNADNAPGFSYSGIVDIEPVEGPLFQIRKFHPKKKGTFQSRHSGELRTCAIEISGPYIFDYIERLRGMIKDEEFTDFPVRSLILEELGTLGCLLPGHIFDIGNPQGYKQCTDYIIQAHE